MEDKPRILVIDDQMDTVELIYLMLAPEYDVVGVSDPTIALDQMALIEPDLILLDILFPNCNGYDIFRKIRKLPLGHSVPIMFLSAKDTISDQKQGYLLGAESYITKPFTPAGLNKIVHSFFEKTVFSLQKKKNPYSFFINKYICP